MGSVIDCIECPNCKKEAYLEQIVKKQASSLSEMEKLLDIRECLSEVQYEQNRILIQQNKWMKMMLFASWLLFSITLFIVAYEKA